MSKTLISPTEFREEIRKSRFHAFASPIHTADKAQAFIDQISDLSATHNCWAWRLGQQYRFNDDGEPGGTAGRPILAAIDGQDCDRVVVVVTRWFGGIKLGTGGLVRAYGGCAAKCLQSAAHVVLVPRVTVAFQCTYSELPLIKARLGEFEALLDGERFASDGVELCLALPEVDLSRIQQYLADLSRGRIRLHRLDTSPSFS
ncbi:putative YigZ family protein [Pseudomonas duriflava]|uniref:Putative YigZ family protein n=1 Tax=Pseudomonas duriflava TaxID=459528 RepID=A0A562QDK3_9PSED|nr:YigZ family protein [Pseudomonas duriflava]TWI54773.1 putative YigZ family protein [Pseudomonas duriflava]